MLTASDGVFLSVSEPATLKLEGRVEELVTESRDSLILFTMALLIRKRSEEGLMDAGELLSKLLVVAPA